MEQWVFSLGDAECEDPTSDSFSFGLCVSMALCSEILQGSFLISSVNPGRPARRSLMIVNIQVTMPGF